MIVDKGHIPNLFFHETIHSRGPVHPADVPAHWVGCGIFQCLYHADPLPLVLGAAPTLRPPVRTTLRESRSPRTRTPKSAIKPRKCEAHASLAIQRQPVTPSQAPQPEIFLPLSPFLVRPVFEVPCHQAVSAASGN
jgi:hypothetical protein